MAIIAYSRGHTSGHASLFDCNDTPHDDDDDTADNDKDKGFSDEEEQEHEEEPPKKKKRQKKSQEIEGIERETHDQPLATFDSYDYEQGFERLRPVYRALIERPKSSKPTRDEMVHIFQVKLPLSLH